MVKIKRILPVFKFKATQWGYYPKLMNVPPSTFLLCSQLSLKALTIFRRCTGSFEPSLLAYAIGTIISWTGLFHGNAIHQDLESWYNQIMLGLCVCAYTISVIMNSQDLPYVVSWGQQDTPRSAKQFVKMFHLFEPRKSRYYYIYWVIYAQKTEIDIQLYKTKRT